jgi:hypothetical protein
MNRSVDNKLIGEYEDIFERVGLSDGDRREKDES